MENIKDMENKVGPRAPRDRDSWRKVRLGEIADFIQTETSMEHPWGTTPWRYKVLGEMG